MGKGRICSKCIRESSKHKGMKIWKSCLLDEKSRLGAFDAGGHDFSNEDVNATM